MSRRSLLRGFSLALAAPWGTGGATAEATGGAGAPSSLGFAEIARGRDDRVHVPPGYRAPVLLRWGDPVLPDAPRFDPRAQTAAAQARQFGYNCDFVAYLPLPRGTSAGGHGLLCVNHEFAWPPLMFPPGAFPPGAEGLAARVGIEVAAHGLSVVEVRCSSDGEWRSVPRGQRNRRITATTGCAVSGPAAGHPRLRTRADPSGRRVAGTLNNCAGGQTPWGTILSCEENFQYYFGGAAVASERDRLRRYGVTGQALFAWYRVDPRFDIGREPNEANRFGWVVEVDPYVPDSTPVKRTALGRLAHEGAAVTVNHDGRVAVYCTDDAPFEYVYKFVSDETVDRRPEKNADLLDRGVLYAARFEADGTLRWRPLVFGQGPLTPENGFRDQGEVMIHARRAADLLGATPMDRPEGIAVNPVTGHAFVMLTANPSRGASRRDAANPRGRNRWGHVLELAPPRAAGGGVDHAAAAGGWEVFLLAGDPAAPGQGARYHPGVSAEGWLVTPDNCAFDGAGRLWIATDGAARHGFADGLWACDTGGAGRALTRHFLRGPLAAEITGPCFTPDDRTLFVSVQHPGQGSGYARPASRWPDHDPDLPPRPAVIAITRDDGGVVGG